MIYWILSALALTLLAVSTLLMKQQNVLARLAFHTLNQAKRFLVLIVGSTVLILGVLMIFLPGPALVVIPMGLVILSVEFVWARRLLKQMKEHGNRWLNSNKKNSPEEQ